MAIRLHVKENKVCFRVSNEKYNLKATEKYPVFPDPYTGELQVIPKAYESTTLKCAHKTMPDDVVVLEVPIYETHNLNGTTIYIASEV